MKTCYFCQFPLKQTLKGLANNGAFYFSLHVRVKDDLLFLNNLSLPRDWKQMRFHPPIAARNQLSLHYLYKTTEL